jgi:hypothetical protein
MVTSTPQDQGLGPISMGVLYCSLTVCSFLAPLFVHWLGARNALLLGLTGYWAFVAANLVPTWLAPIDLCYLRGGKSCDLRDLASLFVVVYMWVH